MKKYNYLLMIMAILFGCDKNRETVGNYKYKTFIERINPGDAGELIYKYKSYQNIEKSDVGFLVLISAQKLGHETENDTVFAYGELKTKTIGNKMRIFIKEIRIKGYEKFSQCDSIIRVFEETDNGKIKFIKNVSYYNGKIQKFEYPKSKVLPDSETPPPPPKKTF
jgi:hypothetical protein